MMVISNRYPSIPRYICPPPSRNHMKRERSDGMGRGRAGGGGKNGRFGFIMIL